MKYERMPIEVESPEEFGYDRIKYNLSESSVRDRTLGDLDRVAARLIGERVTAIFQEPHSWEGERRPAAAQNGGDIGATVVEYVSAAQATATMPPFYGRSESTAIVRKRLPPT